jgi:4-hydroxy-4-methyl-2-oxoglutarate aldolase
VIEIADGLAQRLSALPAATVADALDGAGVIGSEIALRAGRPPLCGIAYTVELPPGDNLGLHLALAEAEAGSVIVASCGTAGYGIWGEIASVAALEAGVAGLVTDGAVRDVVELDALGLPVFARGFALRKAAKAAPGRVRVPVTVGGVVVAPGDLVLGDRDGCVVVPRDDLDRAVERGSAIAAAEGSVVDAVRGGATTLDALGLPSRNEGGAGEPRDRNRHRRHVHRRRDHRT